MNSSEESRVQSEQSRPFVEPPSQADVLRLRTVKRQLMEEFNASWEQGSPIPPEQILAQWPTSAAADRDVASLLYEDYHRRLERGDEPSVSEYETRFPDLKDSLVGQFRQHEFLRSMGISGTNSQGLSLPSVGATVFGFHLRHELGSGAFARVYLAEQVELAGRPVVVKISSAEGDEPKTLAQLQHTHIVPIYSCHESAAAGVRAVCMPYFGGASLSRVLGAVWAEKRRPTSGASFVDGLEAVKGPTLAEVGANSSRGHPATGGANEPALLDRMRGWSYDRVAIWLVAKLAEGLEHAHQRGIFHRDIKPSNILIAADGQPLLLDFNLSQNANDLESQVTATLGGTVAYMAPEHLHAMATRDPLLGKKVDHRSDVYSLGMVLFETLVGRKPFDQSASYTPLPALIEAMAVERSQTTPSLREQHPGASWGLESVVRKCLNPDPARRYQRAIEVADDLQALLNDQPLRHAPELSRKERVQKCLRRHPRLTSAASVSLVACLVLSALSSMLALVWSNWSQTHAELHRSHREQFDDNTQAAFCLLYLPSEFQRPTHLQQGEELCRKNLELFQVLERDDWQSQPAWTQIPSTDQVRISESMREVLILYAWARVRRTADANTLHEAIALLGRAMRIEGLPSTPALWEERAAYLDLLNETDLAKEARARAREIQPASGRDHFLLAVTHMRQGRQAGALDALNEALRLQPHHFWARLQRGNVYLDRGDALLAVSDFSDAIRVWPDAALGYFNRGCALERAGRHAGAVADYSAALERDPDFALAYLNRGLNRLELKQHAAALNDFDAAVQGGLADQAAVQAGRTVALEALGRTADADQAFALVSQQLSSLDDKVRQRIHWVLGFSFASRRPETARKLFEDVLQKRPEQPQALYGLAMLAANAERGDDALDYFNRALTADSNFTDARRFRAVLLARRGQLDQASADINWCLQKEEASGSASGATLYAGACVAAHALEHADPALADTIALQVEAFLAQALAQGYGHDKIATDPDLAPARHLPALKKWLPKSSI